MKSLILSKYMFLALFWWSSVSVALCVKVDRANLRSGPGTRYSKTWEVYKYMPFKKIKRQQKWIKIKDVDGEYHWIFSNLITSSIKCAVVKSIKANFRTGPGRRYSKVLYNSQVDKYASFKLLSLRGQWAKLKDEYGDVGWIHKSLIWIQ